jgi:hypothetical protein
MAEAEGRTLKPGQNVKGRLDRDDPNMIVDPDGYFSKLFGVGRMNVIYARALLRSDPDAAAKVKALRGRDRP